MSSIFHGGNTYIFYNEAADNVQPNNIAYKNIDQLGAFPQVKLNSSTTSIETYNEEYAAVLAGNLSIDSVSIVVHYIADNESHKYLDAAYANGTNFQIKVSLYEYQDSLDQHYIILGGYISGYQDSADQNEVYNRTYTFTAEDLIARGTATDPATLHVGDYGVGSDGETTPHYEAVNPIGNSFIKVPAQREDNPISTDMGGIAYVDNGGEQTAQLAMPEVGDLGLYIKNTDHDWTEIPGKSKNDTYYVPIARTVNGKALSTNITLSSSDTGSVPLTRNVNGKPLSADVVLTSNDTGSVPIERTVNGKPLSADVTLSSTDTGSVPVSTKVNGKTLSSDIVLNKSDIGLDAVLNAVQLVASNNLSDVSSSATARANLSVYSKAEAVPATRTINGKTLSTDVTLSSTDTGSFSVANNLSEGVPGTIRTNISAAKSGSNSDITSMTALSGPLRLGGDGQADGDAITLRQLQAATAGGGSNGATLNGVMNNFLGAVEWFNGTRAALPTGHVAADGQLLKRADYPDIWNAISTGVFLSNTDTAWQATPTSRGVYSTGDGSTTFRMPDINGVWVHPTDSTLNSIPALFLRGDGTVANTGSGAGVIRWGAAPNITGSWNGYSYRNGGGAENSTVGAIQRTSDGNSQSWGTVGSANYQYFSINIDASRSNTAYGRDSTTEVRPNSVKGIWLIRVNGLFSASNTNFNVINGMTTAPATGAVVYGGDSRSALQLNGADYLVARMRSKVVGGGSKTVALGLADSTGSSVVNTEWTLPSTGGELALSTDSRFDTVNGKSGGSISGAVNITGQLSSTQSILVSGSAGGLTSQGTYMRWNETSGTGQGSIVVNPGSGTGGFVFRFINRDNTAQIGSINMFQNGRFAPSQGYCSKQGVNGNINTGNAWNIERGTDNNNYLWIDTSAFLIPQSTSDLTYKTNITDSKAGALDRVLATKTIEYSWNEKANRDDKRHRGFGAQNQEGIDELHIIPSAGSAYPMSLDTVAMLADAYDAIKSLDEMVRSLQEQLTNLQQNNK